MVNTFKKTLYYAKQFATKIFKFASKRVIKKITEASNDLISNKIPDKTTSKSK